MRTTSRHLSALAALALACGGVVVGASAAAADSTSRCIGTAGEVTVTGALVVPSGRTCVLNGTTVHGQVRVQSGANLVVTDGAFTNRVVVGEDGFLDATNTTIDGNVVSNGAYGVYLQDSQVQGNYLGRDAQVEPSFLYATDTRFGGRIESVHGEVYLESTRVGRFVSTEGTAYTSIIDSTIGRELTVAANPGGAVVCASEIDRDAVFIGNGPVQLGTGTSAPECDEVNYFGADLVIDATAGEVEVTGNLIRGDLTGTDNVPRPTGADNRVRGATSGQFVHLVPAGEDRADLRAEGDLRSPTLALDDREDRRDRALSDADRLGTADF